MSLIALFIAFLLLPLHACNARHTFAFVSYTKDAEKATLHKTDFKIMPTVFERKEKLLGHETKSMATLDEHQRVMEIKGFKGKARSMLVSASHETKEAAHTNEGEPVGDVEVTDYVQPHRKSPIHNHH